MNNTDTNLENGTVISEFILEPIEEESADKNLVNEKVLVRKKKVQHKTWKSHIRKIKYQAGESHINARGKHVPERTIKAEKTCTTSCKLKCKMNVSTGERESLLKSYYELNQEGKYNFIAMTTSRIVTKRSTVKSKPTSRRKFSFNNIH